MMKKLTLITFLVIMFALPLVLAAPYGNGKFGAGAFGSGEEEVEEDATTTTTTTTTTGGAGGGGGDGGGGRTPVVAKREFTLSRENIKVTLKQGQTKEVTFTVKNSGDLALEIEVDLKDFKDFLISPSLIKLDITLQPDEEQTVFLVFKAEEDQQPNIYPGEILFKESSGEKIIYTIVEVESAKPLFDVDVEVLPEYKRLLPGKEVFIEVSLFNVRGFGRVDVLLEYSIMDFDGNLIAVEQETVAIETQAKFVRELLIPRGTKPGTYVASVKVTFEDSVGISSDLFEIEAKEIRLYSIPIKDYTFYLLFGIIVIIIISFFLIQRFYPAKKKYVPKTKEEKTKMIKEEGNLNKLKKELNALEQGYKAKFISEESYKKGKERLEKKIKKLEG